VIHHLVSLVLAYILKELNIWVAIGVEEQKVNSLTEEISAINLCLF